MLFMELQYGALVIYLPNAVNRIRKVRRDMSIRPRIRLRIRFRTRFCDHGCAYTSRSSSTFRTRIRSSLSVDILPLPVFFV